MNNKREGKGKREEGRIEKLIYERETEVVLKEDEIGELDVQKDVETEEAADCRKDKKYRTKRQKDW